jgi:hypothetical protein
VNRVTEWIFGLPWWGALVALAFVLVACAELGFRLGRVGAGAHGAARAGQLSVVLGGLLGLLGLLLGFSFSIVESRYSVRKSLVLDEANAIGTAYLRAGLLPDDQGQRVRALLREYVDLRLRPMTPAELQKAIERSGRIHGDLWRQAEIVGKAHSASEVVSLFVASLNDVIDLHSSRVSISLHEHLPPAIFNVLLTVSLVVLFMLGYASGLGNLREPVATAALVVSIAAVMVLIRQLDAPGAPMFRINQWAMEDVRRSMSESR